MRREAKVLLEKAVDSLVLAVEHFNRPWDRGRHEATLVFLDRAFELLLKAALIHRSYRIRESAASNTFGFERCVNKCVSEAVPPILTHEEAVTARLLNGLRDGAQHYLIDVSEQQLYVYTQAGVTLFSDKLEAVFGQRLADHLPERVLPVSTKPPKDLESLISTEFEEIRTLVAPRSRQRLLAASRLRSLAVLENALSDDSTQPTKRDLDRLVRRVRAGEEWRSLFPGVARLELASEGTGLTVSIRLTKAEGTPVRLVKEGSPEAADATLPATKRVNELDFYSMGLRSLATKLGISEPRAVALVNHLRIQDNSEYFKAIRVDSQLYKRYSARALDLLKKTLPTIDMKEVWRLHRPGGKKKAG
jgi:Domain of unknown function (DUF3644)